MGSLTGYLSFDPTDANTIDSGASIGSFVRSGKSGALITNHNTVENPGISFVFVDGDISASTIAETAHGLDTGDMVRFTTSGTLPTGLALATDYYVIRVSANSFKLAYSPQNAELGTAITITADGSGNHTLTSQEMQVKSLDVHIVNPIAVELTQADEVTVFQGTSPWVVSATDLDIRDLSHTQDSIKIGDGTDFLAVNGDGSINAVVTSTDLDIRDLAFATDSVDVSGSSVSITGTVAVTQSTSPWVVSATDLDIRDLTAASDSVDSWLNDGAGTALTSTLNSGKQSLDVNITGGDLDDDLANVAIESTATAVSTAAVNVVASALAARKYLGLANEGNIKLYFGKNGVTTANGFPLYAREKMLWRIGPAVSPQVIGGPGASSEDLRVIELS